MKITLNTQATAVTPVAQTFGELETTNGVTIESSVGAWLAAKRSENTRSAYRRDLASFTNWLTIRGGTLATAKPAAVDAFATHLLEVEGRAPSTVHRTIAAVSSFYTFAARPGQCFEGQPNPASTHVTDRVQPDSTPAMALSTDEVRRLRKAASESKYAARDTAVVMILSEAGLRVSELCTASVEDVRQVSGHWVLTVKGKGRQTRPVTLSAGACDLIDLDRETGPLVLNNNEERLNRHQVTRILNRLAKAAELDALTPHMLRATCATIALEENWPLWAVQDLLGHADPRRTRGYQQRGQSLEKKAAMTASLSAAFTPPTDNT